MGDRGTFFFFLVEGSQWLTPELNLIGGGEAASWRREEGKTGGFQAVADPEQHGRTDGASQLGTL